MDDSTRTELDMTHPHLLTSTTEFAKEVSIASWLHLHLSVGVIELVVGAKVFWRLGTVTERLKHWPDPILARAPPIADYAADRH